jgi:hypothetical protein
MIDLVFSYIQWLTVIQRGETDFFSGEPLRALSTLVFSDNVDLQRSASLTFAEITERGTYTGYSEAKLSDSDKSKHTTSARQNLCDCSRTGFPQ